MGIYICAATGTKGSSYQLMLPMWVHPNSENVLHNVYSELEMLYRGKHRLPMCGVASLYLCKQQINIIVLLGAHIDCPASEIENVSCCLLIPAGINEKYHCALTLA